MVGRVEILMISSAILIIKCGFKSRRLIKYRRLLSSSEFRLSRVATPFGDDVAPPPTPSPHPRCAYARVFVYVCGASAPHSARKPALLLNAIPISDLYCIYQSTKRLWEKMSYVSNFFFFFKTEEKHIF